jgi:ABC-2 type transport system ATP-binding protein
VAEALCDRIAIMHKGRIRALGSMEELRAEAKAGGALLEEIFLKLTGVEQVASLVANLREPSGASGVRRQAPESDGR